MALACVTLAGQAWSATDPASESLVLFVAEAAAPKMFVQDHQPVGYITELTVEALRRAGYEVEIKVFPWARAVMNAQAGFGVATSLSHTPERDKVFVFSDPIYEDRVLMLTRKDTGLRLNGLRDLAGLRVGVQQGASFGPEYEAALPTFILERDIGADLRLRKLAAGRLDVAILSGGPPAVRYYAALAGVDLDILNVQKNPLVVDYNHIAVARSRPDAHEIIRRVNAALASMRRDGSSARIIKRYE